MKQLTVFIILLLQKLNGIQCIRCYQCSSAEDPAGEDNCGAYEVFHREKHVLTECNTDESKSPGTFCMKITQQGPRGFIWDGRWRQVIRRCASETENGIIGVCNWGVLENGVYWENCYCSENGCNSSSNLKYSIILILSTMIASTIYINFIPR